MADATLRLLVENDALPLPSPLPDGLPQVEAFSYELLPESLRPWLLDAADRLQCAPDYLAVSAMVALSAVVGRQLGIRPKEQDNWLVIPNLWGCIVGRPSMLKSPAITEALRPLKRLERVANEQHESDVSEWNSGEIVRDVQRKLSKENIRKALKGRKSDEAQELAQNLNESEQPEPSLRRYSTNDCTVEKLGELLKSNPRGLLILRDELMGFLRGLDKEGQESARAFYLEAWAGQGDFTYDRIGRGTVQIPGACVAVLGGVQPGPLHDYLRDALRGGRGDDGLAQRFQLFAWPDHTGFKYVDRWPDTAARQAASVVFERLDRIDIEAVGAQREDGELVPFLRFSPQAQMIFANWYTTWIFDCRNGELPGCLESHLTKYASLVPSLALLIHLADCGTGGVSENALSRACAWADYLASHAKRLYAPAVSGDAIAARELARRIIRGGLQSPFSLRDVYRHGWTGLATPQQAEEAVEVLCELRGLYEVEDKNTGGRPSVRFHVNRRIREVWQP